jgi:putative transposase
MIEGENQCLSIQRQCELLDIARSSYYYEAVSESDYNLILMRLMDEQFLETPFYGYRRMHQRLADLGYEANIKRIHRLWRLMGHEAIYPKPRTTTANPAHIKHPYLLKGLAIERANQVWSTDITFVPMPHGYLYLVAIMDWYSRQVLSWELSNTMSVDFCLRALNGALTEYGTPKIFNTDQGAQFTSNDFTGLLAKNNIAISMDGAIVTMAGRALDNVFIERLWRSVKYECLYIHRFETGLEVGNGLETYFDFYNMRRPHQSLNGQKPFWVYNLSMDQQRL